MGHWDLPHPIFGGCGRWVPQGAEVTASSGLVKQRKDPSSEEMDLHWRELAMLVLALPVASGRDFFPPGTASYCPSSMNE